jgi:hypothetical protein
MMQLETRDMCHTINDSESVRADRYARRMDPADLDDLSDSEIVRRLAQRDMSHQAETPPLRQICDHRCLLDAGHLDRGEPHYYGYTLVWKPAGGMVSAPSIEVGWIVLEALNAEGLVDGWWVTEQGTVLVALRATPAAGS